MKLTRFSKQPVLAPEPGHDWEDLVVTNPAAFHDEKTGKVYLLYRAAGKDPRYIVHLGLAESSDGYHFTRSSDRPVLSPLDGFVDGGGVEDPRLVKFGEWYYLPYACRPFVNGQYWLKPSERKFRFIPDPSLPEPLCSNGMNTAIAFSKDLRNWIRAGFITEPGHEDHDVILFPEKIHNRFYYLHRPVFGTEIPGIWLADTDNPLRLRNSRKLAFPVRDWEAQKIGANAPPIKTDKGWLVIYHGLGSDDYYRLGALLLDLEKPDTVIARTEEPIFEPEEWYELAGCHSYKGVVFPCGNVVINGELLVYYGAADKYIGIAHCNLEQLLNEMIQHPGIAHE